MQTFHEDRRQITAADGVALDARALRFEGAGGAVLLVHGFSVDLHEEGTFDKLVQALARRRLSTVRFSFRGHGESAGKQEEMTIAGERLDLSSAYRAMVEQNS